jgi:hypothetical protein
MTFPVHVIRTEKDFDCMYLSNLEKKVIPASAFSGLYKYSPLCIVQ